MATEIELLKRTLNMKLLTKILKLIAFIKIREERFMENDYDYYADEKQYLDESYEVKECHEMMPLLWYNIDVIIGKFKIEMAYMQKVFDISRNVINEMIKNQDAFMIRKIYLDVLTEFLVERSKIEHRDFGDDDDDEAPTEVVRFKHLGKNYLLSQNYTLYDEKTGNAIGIWNAQGKFIVLIDYEK